MENNSFVWDPVDYAKSSESQYLWAKELLSKIQFSGNEKILDVGCGDGKITAEIASLVPSGFVIGIDSSSEMIDHAKTHYGIEKYPNLNFKLMSADEINLSEEFDLVFSNAVLHWIENQERVLNGISGCLKKGGRIIISCGGKGNASEILSVLDEMIICEKWNKYFPVNFNTYYFYSDEEYKTWLQRTGFVYSNATLVVKDMMHNSEESLKGWIRTTWLPYTQRLPDELKEEFINEVVSIFLKKNPKDLNGIIHVKMVRLEVDACKI